MHATKIIILLAFYTLNSWCASFSSSRYYHQRSYYRVIESEEPVATTAEPVLRRVTQKQQSSTNYRKENEGDGSIPDDADDAAVHSDVHFAIAEQSLLTTKGVDRQFSSNTNFRLLSGEADKNDENNNNSNVADSNRWRTGNVTLYTIVGTIIGACAMGVVVIVVRWAVRKLSHKQTPAAIRRNSYNNNNSKRRACRVTSLTGNNSEAAAAVGAHQRRSVQRGADELRRRSSMSGRQYSARCGVMPPYSVYSIPHFVHQNFYTPPPPLQPPFDTSVNSRRASGARLYINAAAAAVEDDYAALTSYPLMLPTNAHLSIEKVMDDPGAYSKQYVVVDDGSSSSTEAIMAQQHDINALPMTTTTTVYYNNFQDFPINGMTPPRRMSSSSVVRKMNSIDDDDDAHINSVYTNHFAGEEDAAEAAATFIHYRST